MLPPLPPAPCAGVGKLGRELVSVVPRPLSLPDLAPAPGVGGRALADAGSQALAAVGARRATKR